MHITKQADSYDVAIIGGGPAGLTAAVVLGRACRRIILFDHGKPRNYAARAIHGFLGLDGIAPKQLLERARHEAQCYDVQTENSEVKSIDRIEDSMELSKSSRFRVTTSNRTILARAVLLATGVIDEVPKIPGIEELYGVSVHHCPYCDAWEHRGKHLVALADGSAAIELALSLLPWSKHVTCCANGTKLTSADLRTLSENSIITRTEPIAEIVRSGKARVEVRFESGEKLACDAIFFGAAQRQHSELPTILGCEIDEDGLIRRDSKQRTCVEGVFAAGDAAGDVQFAIVAAAQGATAAAAIHRMLQEQETVRSKGPTN
jgi:thioredoxin reductase